jgi:acetyl-CoA carboxylase carboxyltransferase component
LDAGLQRTVDEPEVPVTGARAHLHLTHVRRHRPEDGVPREARPHQVGPRTDDEAGSAPPKISRPASLREATSALARRRRAAIAGPGAAATARQQALGKLTVRRRLELLLDEDSFVELDALARHRATGFGLDERRPDTDGVVTGWGTVQGRRVVVFAHDSRIFGGALGEVFAAKIQKVLDLAEETGTPVIGLNDGGGARIQEGIAALAGFGGIFARNVRMSGVVPQLSVVLGACAGGAVYSPALTDFVLVVRGTAKMFITGPDVIAAVTGERISQEDLGGAHVHATRTGVAAFAADDEEASLDQVRHLLSFLPSNNQEEPPYLRPTDDPDRPCDVLLDLVPAEPQRTYDVRAVVEEVVDDGEYLEVHAEWARNVVCCFARLDGHVVGIVANQPAVLAGTLDVNAAEKAARFVRTCDCFNIPLVTFVDVPGFLPGADQEHAGMIRRGAKLLYAYCEATVPRVQIILRKAYGGAYIVMDSKSIGADLSFAWPVNEVAVMGAEAAADIVFRKELAAAADPQARRHELLTEYEQRLMTPYVAAERGLVDDVIDPRSTRSVLIRSLALLRSKRRPLPQRKHGNGPL